MQRALVVFLLVSLGSLTSAQGQGQRTARGSVRRDLVAVEALPAVELPRINLGAVLKEDAERELEGLPPRFAIPIEVKLSPESSGLWENLDPATLLWRLRIRAAGATSLNLGFGRCRLSAKAALHVYSRDLTHVVRPFTAEDNEPHGELWTPVVGTDDLVVELVIPLEELDELELEVSQIGRGYRGFGAPTTELVLSGSCNVDVVCPQGDPWELEIPSVGVISTGGSTFCTGFLVNNLRQDLKPYFMTANHCGINAGNAASLVVYWNFENTTCRPPGSPQSGGPGDGSLAQFNTGSFFRAASSASDFTLVELDDAINPAFDVSWAGWDATGANGTSAIAIHHPNTDEKRISFENDPTTTTSYLGEAVPGDGTHVRITDWDLGTTEPGSSGSPLFNQLHRVIGQLHGGFASCSSQTSDWYGRFSVSWNGGGTNSTRLKNWLDPDNSGTLVIDSVSLGTLCSEQGTLTLERARFACEDALEIVVVDCDLNTNSSTVQTVVVGADSDSEPLGESVTLTETGPATSRFEGTLPLSGTNGAGTLLVAHDDTVTARYVDADDGQGGINVQVTDTATIDCQPPAILSVGISNVESDFARLNVQSDEPVTAGADHGTDCDSLSSTAGGEGLATNATVDLEDLFPNTTYFLHARATDEAGNETVDDNGGLCHSFTTLDVPDFFTEEFVADNDLDGRVLLFGLDMGQEGYSLCTRPVSALPTNPAGGNTLSLSDDGTAQVVLSGGKTVQLYGQSYGSLWVNANGNLTFTSGDGDYTESLSEHFAVPRVAACYDDFNPAAGGTVSWKQLANRVAVTWQNVPEYNTSNQNTFQIELFFNGVVRLSYLAVAATDGIAGLSEGEGLDPGYLETNLSAAPQCTGGPVTTSSANPR